MDFTVDRHLIIAGSQSFNSFFTGDVDENSGDISGTVASNNGDSYTVLSTVGQIVFHFTSLIADAHIFIQGSTASRTRLYQQAQINFYPLSQRISKYLDIMKANGNHLSGENYEKHPLPPHTGKLKGTIEIDQSELTLRSYNKINRP